MGVEPKKSGRTLVVVLVVVILLLGALFGYYYVQSTNTVNSLNETIALKDAQISALSATVAANTLKIANLTAQVQSLQAIVDALTAGYTQANATIASLNAQVASLNSQISSLNAQITQLQSQNADLMDIIALNKVTVQVPTTTFHTNGSTTVISFSADYAGYVIVTMTAASDFAHEGIEVNNTFASSINSPYYTGIIMPGEGFFYAFSGVPDAQVFPVVPGIVTVYLQTSDLSDQTATLTVTYYY